MTRPTDSADYHDHPVYRELSRIFGDLEKTGETKFFLLLPLVTEDEFVAFLQTVPAGTPWQRLSELASAYRAEHPIVPDDSESPDSE